ncbi:MAG: acyltransferase [Bacteroidales bacterium]|nr:acyltransferase [Bacteroidales bacterium]
MKPKETTTHLYNLDLLRALAMVLVVLQHAWTMSEMDTDEWGWLCHGYRILIGVGVPLFVVLSGALLLDAPVLSFREFYRRRMSRVLLPFLVWATVVYTFSFLTHKYEDISTWQDFVLSYIPYLITNRINDSHWFVHMILALYLMAPFLQRALLQCSQRVVASSLVAWFVVMVLRVVWPDVYGLRYVSSLFPFIGCFVAGYYLKHYAQQLPLRRNASVALVLLTLVDIVELGQYSVLPHCMAIALFGLFLTKPLLQCPKWARLGLLVSSCSYMIYLVHIPLIRSILVYTGITADPAQPGQALLQPVWLAAIALVVCCLMGLVIERLPRWAQRLLK